MPTGSPITYVALGVWHELDLDCALVVRVFNIIDMRINTGSENPVCIVKRRNLVNNLGESLKLVSLEPCLILAGHLNTPN